MKRNITVIIIIATLCLEPVTAFSRVRSGGFSRSRSYSKPSSYKKTTTTKNATIKKATIKKEKTVRPEKKKVVKKSVVDKVVTQKTPPQSNFWRNMFLINWIMGSTHKNNQEECIDKNCSKDKTNK